MGRPFRFVVGTASPDRILILRCRSEAQASTERSSRPRDP